MSDTLSSSQPLAPRELPVALSIAGSDSGGGAGIQADLRAFSAFGVFGTTAITAVTAQNPRGVRDVAPVPPATVAAQLAAVLEAFRVGAAKTGMLFSAEIIRSVAAVLRTHPALPVVADPVMLATSGAKLLRDDAVQSLCGELFPRALLVTPNLPEAAVLAGRALDGAAAVRAAARELAGRFGCRVLVKGGHNAAEPGTDYLADGSRLWRFRSPLVPQPPSTHGTGCSLSAAIAANLAADRPLPEAVRLAKAYVLGAIRNGVAVGPDLFAMWPAPRLPLDEIEATEVADA